MSHPLAIVVEEKNDQLLVSERVVPNSDLLVARLVLVCVLREVTRSFHSNRYVWFLFIHRCLSAVVDHFLGEFDFDGLYALLLPAGVDRIHS